DAVFFFFSSSRRHTSFSRDWSSDVCSSDLVEEYSAGINRRLADTPNADVWFESGRYRGFDDIERRAEIVPEMVARYYDYVANNPDVCVIWVADDGTPGIALGIVIDLDGVRVRGYIDQVTDRGNT